MTDLTWFLYYQAADSFPYWVFIEEEPGKFLFLKAKEKWPGPGKNLFCLLEEKVAAKDLPEGEPLDKIRIAKLGWYGKRLLVILDRPIRRRCWFIFTKKEYKERPGEFYDQVFWITQSSAVAERRGAYLPRRQTATGVKIIIDSAERYAYQFPGFETEKRKLAVGDYALEVDGQVEAVVERKTKDNLYHEVKIWDVVAARFRDLCRFTHKAVVIECDYTKFLEGAKEFYSPSYLADLVADLYANFPDLPIVFLPGRKSANRWVIHYFQRLTKKPIKS